MKSLVIIPARGGSKGVPGKNIKPLGGKPLILYTVEAARQIALDEDIYVSTDSQKIVDVVESVGLKVPTMRPAHLATDESSIDDVISHAIKHFDPDRRKYETIMLLQPTSPLRTAQHIKEAVDCLEDGVDLIVSVKKTSSNPYYVLLEENSDGFLDSSKKMENLHRRQDTPEVFELNGAIYFFRTDKFNEQGSISKIKKKKKYLMIARESIDIDTELDWDFAEFLLQSPSF